MHCFLCLSYVFNIDYVDMFSVQEYTAFETFDYHRKIYSVIKTME